MAIRISSRAVPAGETLIAASRQVWLASLGAAVVTGEWAQKEAAPLFRTLVKEGTAIESRSSFDSRRGLSKWPPKSALRRP